jgi:hypothetical protein
MRSLTTFLLAAVLMMGTGYAYAQPYYATKADTATELMDEHLSGFTRIKIAGPFDVHLVQGTEESVKIEVPEDVKGRITAKVTGNVLKIHNTHDNWGSGYQSWYSEKSVWRNHKKIVVYITAKDLSAITVSGSGHVKFDAGISSNSLTLKLRGSGEMMGKVDVKKLDSHVSGSGNIKLSGTAEHSAVRVSGSGNFSAPELLTSISAAKVSGSGRAKINASEKVNAAVSGSGGVSYTGAAKDVNKSKSGSGEISRF